LSVPGTIGHVAHGKSTVVKAISGVKVRVFLRCWIMFTMTKKNTLPMLSAICHDFQWLHSNHQQIRLLTLNWFPRSKKLNGPQKMKVFRNLIVSVTRPIFFGKSLSQTRAHPHRVRRRPFGSRRSSSATSPSSSATPTPRRVGALGRRQPPSSGPSGSFHSLMMPCRSCVCFWFVYERYTHKEKPPNIQDFKE